MLNPINFETQYGIIYENFKQGYIRHASIYRHCFGASTLWG